VRHAAFCRGRTANPKQRVEFYSIKDCNVTAQVRLRSWESTLYQGGFMMAEWLEPGQDAADFTLPADDGSQVTLSNLQGSPVVLFFYPKDDTPG
jgi:hypothetical protein